MVSPTPGIQQRVVRIEVRPRPHAGDPKATSLTHDAAALGIPLTSLSTARVYLIQGALPDDDVTRIADSLLADPVLEHATIQHAPTRPDHQLIEVHPLPGVMDPAAQSVRDAIHALTGHDVQVSTGWRYDLPGLNRDQAATLARRLLANPVVHAIHHEPFAPASLPRGHDYTLSIRHVAIRDLDATALERLSRDAHLFLDLAEMRAIQDYYTAAGRDPTEIELETLAQTWSEHCVHKTLKSTIRYQGAPSASSGAATPDGSGRVAEWQSGKVKDRGENSQPSDAVTPRTLPLCHSATLPLLDPSDPINWSNRPNHTLNPDGSVTIRNLLKSTVAAATHELIQDGVDWCLSVFVDNAGIIAFDDHHAVCVKVETHNHPSAIEPYGGSATGIGGCIRDILGTGLGAKPIASTDVFCVAFPDDWSETATQRNSETGSVNTEPLGREAASPAVSLSRSLAVSLPLPPGCLHPRRVLTDVVAGVRDYGNRMGIPTVSGAVWFDNRHIGNPLVFCGCIGLMPRWAIGGKARAGDRIIALGGRTGRDGIHGATFSSAELTDTHADEFAHAVQIGNAIEEKRVMDAVLRARDWGASETAKQRNSETGKKATLDFGREAAPTPASLSRSLAVSLFSAITDCGAGGFSSAVGEMGADLGATVHLDRAPLKYAGLSPTEIWISEAQERMVLAVPPENLDTLARICHEEGVEMADLGEFGTPNAELILLYRNTEVGRLSMHLLHEGIPTPTREAIWQGAPSAGSGTAADDRSGKVTKWQSDKALERGMADDPTGAVSPRTLPLSHSATLPLLSLLAHPNIASKHWIIRQYDHEVQGRTVIKPLTGPGQGPSDAAVIEPVPGTNRGLAISQGLSTGYMVEVGRLSEPVSRRSREQNADPSNLPATTPHSGRRPETGSESRSTPTGSESRPTPAPTPDPYLMTLAAIDECVRNLVCAGADPSRIAILDNFCWPSCKKPHNLATLVRAAEACYDGAKAYRTPFVSGKDSLNNQFTIPGQAGQPPRTIEIPPTLLITGIGIVPTLDRACTIDAKTPGNLLLLVGQTQHALAGSHLAAIAAPEAGSPGVAGVPPAGTPPTHEHIDPDHPALSHFPRTDLTLGPRLARAVHNLIVAGHVASAHDVSDGGLLCAVAEMLIAAGTPLGAELLGPEPARDNAAPTDPTCWAFGESPSRYILEIEPTQLEAVRTLLADLPCEIIGQLTSDARLRWPAANLDTPVPDLHAAWTRTLDW